MSDKIAQAGQLTLFSLCLVAVVCDLAQHASLTGYSLGALGVALLILVAPMAAKWKIGLSGVEFERVVEEREKAEVAAQVAEQSRRLARVYYIIGACMTTRLGVGAKMIRDFEAWLAAASLEPQTMETLRTAVPFGDSHLVELVDDLVAFGLVQRLSGSGGDRIEVVPDMRQAVREAVGPAQAT